MTYPNLAGIATGDLVEQIGGSFKASYINWARTMHLLHEFAPGWLPETVPNGAGGLIHRAPIGAYLLIRFVHADGQVTPSVPQSFMNAKNNSIPFDEISSRDLTDTQVRGICKAAALLFGLAYELWAKMPLESGYADEEKPAPVKASRPGQPTSGAWESISDDKRAELTEVAVIVNEYHDAGDVAGCVDYLESKAYDSDTKIALWTQLGSKVRTAIKKEHEARRQEA